MEKFSERKWAGKIYIGDIQAEVHATKFVGNRGKMQEWYGEGSVSAKVCDEFESMIKGRSSYRTKIGEIKIGDHEKKKDILTFQFSGKGNPKF